MPSAEQELGAPYMSSAISFNNVSLKLGSELVLDNINVDLQTNELVVIFGPNGAGKSCFLDLITGEKSPTEGEVSLLQGNVLDNRKYIGLVQQGISSLANIPMTVEQFVIYGRYRFLKFGKSWSAEDRKIALDSLEKVGLADLKSRSLKGLSGGELQRVVLARAITSEPKILLLDEASSALDVEATESIFNLLVGLKQQMTILFVTHDLSVVSKNVDKVMCLNKKLISHGKPEEVLTQETLRCVYGDNVNFFTHCHVSCHH